MMLSKRALLIVAMMMVALVSVACGDTEGGSDPTREGGSDPTSVAKTYIESLFKGDINAAQNVLCEFLNVSGTFESLKNDLAAMGMGGEFVFTGLTYTYDSNAQVVNVSGEIKVNVNGQEIPLPISLSDLFLSNIYVRQEESGRWTVCVGMNSPSQ